MSADPIRICDLFLPADEVRTDEGDSVLLAHSDPAGILDSPTPNPPDAAGAFPTEKARSKTDDESDGDPTYPAGVEPLVKRRRRRMRWAIAVGLLLGPGIAAALTPVGGSTAIVGWLVGGITSFTGLLVAFAFWTDDRGVLGRLAAFRRGDHLARWTYTPEEWQAHDEKWTPASPVGQAFIGRDCALCGGKFIQWDVIGCSLEKLIFVVGPPVLIQFILYHYDSNGAQWRESLCIPVPSGKEAEAHRIIEVIVHGQRKSYFAMVIFGLLALASALLLALKVAMWAGAIK